MDAPPPSLPPLSKYLPKQAILGIEVPVNDSLGVQIVLDGINSRAK